LNDDMHAAGRVYTVYIVKMRAQLPDGDLLKMRLVHPNNTNTDPQP